MYEDLYGFSGYKEKEPEEVLSHVGTRYQHYQELREIWELGLGVLKGMNPEYLGPTDEAKIGALNNAIFLITKHIDNIGQFGKYGTIEHNFRYMIDSIPKNPEDIKVDKHTGKE
jgi:hypothetical protein